MLAGTKIRANSSKVIECGNDSKKLFNLINNLTGRVKSNPMPPGRTDETMANEFADFFLGKINKMRWFERISNKIEIIWNRHREVVSNTTGGFNPRDFIDFK